MQHINDSIGKFSEDEFVKTLEEIIENPTDEIFIKYKDLLCTPKQFDEATVNIVINNNNRRRCDKKPSIHFFLPINEEIKELPRIIGNNSEQNMLKQIFTYISNIELENETEKHNFIFEFAEKYNSLFKNIDTNIMEDILNDIPIDNTFGLDLKSIYRDLKKIYKFKFFYHQNKRIPEDIKEYFGINKDNLKDKYNEINTKLEFLPKDLKINGFEEAQYSFMEFLKDNNILKQEDHKIYAYKSKTIAITKNSTSTNFQNIWKKTGISHDTTKFEPPKREVQDTIDFESYIDVDKFLKLSIEDSGLENFKENEFLKYYDTHDHEFAKMLKKDMVEQYYPFYERIMKTNAFYFLRSSHYINQQLLHFSLLNMKEYTFSAFNIGIPNFFILIAGCHNKVFSEGGKPFMCCVVTENPDYYNNGIFGKVSISKIKGTNYFFVCTNWRRLPTFKLTHMKDSYYSVLSSIMNSFLSCSNLESAMIPGKYEYIFAYRMLISLCTNQKCAEILMDARYAYMSTFATYTNISKLLIEKFGPPYTSSFECWLVNRLLTRLPIINKFANENGLELNLPDFEYGIRKKETMGGTVYLPSLWGDYFLADINEILDEAFCYVHTMKEPSNVFHENIKAIKTIVDFQDEFDNLPNYIKKGNIYDRLSIRNYLKHDTKIGFSSGVIYHSTKYTLSMEKPNIKKIVHEINDEPLSELISTKAVISDLNRQVVEDTNLTKRYINKRIKTIKHYSGKEPTDKEKENIKSFYLKTKTKYYNERKSRQRVIETILDKLIDNTKLESTVDLANDFIINESGKVVADICIKAQYGSKREFYVINIGAKALARCTEVFFRKISENSPNEAISIPGDQKIITMQKMLDKIFLNKSITENLKIKFVNGDCTKWSAAETMGSFLAMINGMESLLPPNMYQLLCSTFNAWSEKKIQVPMDILSKVFLPTAPIYDNLREKLKYLKDSNVQQSGQLLSTQNFLQGMFNYASSYKAVCCTNYTYRIWKKIYPNKVFYMEHLEHSDDYVLVIAYENEEDFIKFRVLQKIMMRLHGYNDSDRKTNCQDKFMEFVSQLSFNGIMLYPQIKKSKEVNTNLPCTGYKQDMDAALSRVGECMRVGCNQTFLYFFQRWHSICVADAYSLLPHMTNCFENQSFNELLNTPIEFFGIPDILPLFSLFCRGNVNNYRLYQYGNDCSKTQILYAFELACSNFEKEDFMSENNDYSYSLFNPKYLYDNNNKNIIKLRKD